MVRHVVLAAREPDAHKIASVHFAFHVQQFERPCETGGLHKLLLIHDIARYRRVRGTPVLQAFQRRSLASLIDPYGSRRDSSIHPHC